jgi:hypothetical protein
VLNAMGLEFVTFGNHEFEEDFTARDILDRMNESKFTWVCSNFEFSDGDILKEFLNHPRFTRSELIRLSDGNFIDLIGVLYKSKYSHIGRSHDPMVFTRDLIELRKEELAALGAQEGSRVRGVTFVAMTHQPLNEDVAFAKDFPEIRLIMGGHDHDVREQDAEHLIVKTQSNARTVRLNWLVAVPSDEVDASVAGADAREAWPKFYRQLFSTVVSPSFSSMFLGSERPTPDDLERLGMGLAEYIEHEGLVDKMRMVRSRSGLEYVFVWDRAKFWRQF